VIIIFAFRVSYEDHAWTILFERGLDLHLKVLVLTISVLLWTLCVSDTYPGTSLTGIGLSGTYSAFKFKVVYGRIKNMNRIRASAQVPVIRSVFNAQSQSD
jgi:hypothetical protein